MTPGRMQRWAPLLLALPASMSLAVFVLIPVAWIVRVSFYQDIAGGHMEPAWTLENYERFLGSLWNLVNILWFSLKIAIATTAISIVLAYPLSVYVARSTGRWRQVLITLTLAPLLIGIVSLVYGWIVIFRGGGLLNAFALWVGLIDAPIQYMYNIRGVFILLVYIGIPFIVLTLLDSLERINPSLVEAGLNAGASQWQCFTRIVLPLTVPGLYAGALIVFALNFSAFAIPLMVGSTRTNMIGLVIYRQAMELSNMPYASAISVIMVLTSIVTMLAFSVIIYRRYLNRLGV